jgi:hypothetical protein
MSHVQLAYVITLLRKPGWMKVVHGNRDAPYHSEVALGDKRDYWVGVESRCFEDTMLWVLLPWFFVALTLSGPN